MSTQSVEGAEALGPVRKLTLIEICDRLWGLFQLQDVLAAQPPDQRDPEEEAEIQRELDQLITVDLAHKTDGLGWFDRRCDLEVAGLQDVITDVETKIGAVNKRKMRVRELVRYAMTKLNTPCIKGDVTTINLYDGKDSLVILDEQIIPEEYFTEETVIVRTLDKKRLKRDLATKHVPGARLKTGDSYLTYK